jgi:hypothetical protein
VAPHTAHIQVFHTTQHNTTYESKAQSKTIKYTCFRTSGTMTQSLPSRFPSPISNPEDTANNRRNPSLQVHSLVSASAVSRVGVPCSPAALGETGILLPSTSQRIPYLRGMSRKSGIRLLFGAMGRGSSMEVDQQGEQEFGTSLGSGLIGVEGAGAFVEVDE